MSNYLRCIECGRDFRELYEDPITPPLQIGDCLCHQCTDIRFEELIEDTEEYLEEVLINRSEHNKNK